MLRMRKKMNNLELKLQSPEKMLKDFREIAKEWDACKKAGHSNAKVFSYDPLRRIVWYECKDCPAMYKRSMNYRESKRADDLLNMRFTI